MQKEIIVGYLYPEYMNIYGDTGNIRALQFRANLRGIKVSIKSVSKSSEIHPKESDILFFGGGQDEQQGFVARDIQKYKDEIREQVEKGIPALTVCGGYQLFGKYYRPFEGEDLPGLDIFDIQTNASNTRMIDNLCVKTEQSLLREINSIYSSEINIPKTLVGFENHSGQTTLNSGSSLGKPLYGFGNNESKMTEGYRYKNAFGTYMHGSLLPKNPHFADFLLFKALETKYHEPIKLQVLDDSLEYQAHQYMCNKLGIHV